MIRSTILEIALIASFAPASGIAQSTYQVPPAPIPRILDADSLPWTRVSPDGSWLLLMEPSGMPSITDVAEPVLGLAGRVINPQNSTKTLVRSFSCQRLIALPPSNCILKGLRLRNVRSSTEIRLSTPPGARINNAEWSPDSRHVAFTITGKTSTTLWVADVGLSHVRQLSGVAISGTTDFNGSPCAWLSSNSALICKTVPSGRGTAPESSRDPSGPIVEQADGSPHAPLFTYANILKDATDEALFEYYMSSQIAKIHLNGRVDEVGPPGIYTTVLPSPDEHYVVLQRVHRPYSHVVDMYGFPNTTVIWDLLGRNVREIGDTPLQEITATTSAIDLTDVARVGPREVAWRADAPATLVWAEAIDGGNPQKPAAKRDRLYALAAPFSGTPFPLIDLDYRYASVQWTRGDLAFVTEKWFATRWTRTWAINPLRPGNARLVFDRSSRDVYGDPGTFVLRSNVQGALVVRTTADGTAAYLSGTGASTQGEHPFLDRLNLISFKTERLWQSADPYYESVVAVLDDEATRLVTIRESVNEPPNYCVRSRADGSLIQLTQFTDPVPELAGVTPELITYKRADGLKLSALLYLPRGYDKKQGPLPFVIWAYPQDYRSSADAAQVRGSAFRFKRPSTRDYPLFLLTQGYGVMDHPAFPIVGDGQARPNDTFVEQLVADATAAVDKLVEMGVADRNRIAIAGESYGSFMAANLVVHSDLFRAGIAVSGLFNLTLTPFGFQAENRTLWQARDVYIKMSPFMWADKLHAPLLLIHGDADGNSGTWPMQSERLFAAIKGNGGRARYVRLPYESHGYVARESVGHALWEMVRWLDIHVKNAPQCERTGADPMH